jgi:hypothetical protein
MSLHPSPGVEIFFGSNSESFQIVGDTLPFESYVRKEVIHAGDSR